jgi:omega-6 fatty acid desaturase (delta-12 desaturase)
MVPPEQVWRSIVYLDAAILGFYGAAAFLFGWPVLFTVCIPVIALTAIIGGWLFFIQHQFEHGYWEKGDKWKFRSAALKGSSYYDLPGILQWFTGNIGLHHIHHLCPAIPNYRLQQCMNDSAELPHMNRMTFWQSLKCVKYTLWDEESQCMIGFRQLARKAAA